MRAWGSVSDSSLPFTAIRPEVEMVHSLHSIPFFIHNRYHTITPPGPDFRLLATQLTHNTNGRSAPPTHIYRPDFSPNKTSPLVLPRAISFRSLEVQVFSCTSPYRLAYTRIML